MFKDNKYTKWYFNIINQSKIEPSKEVYFEIHHIIPKSLGGSDDHSNLVKLTARKHFICHLLLTKMTQGHEQKLMQFAVGKFIQNSPFQNRKFNSWEYKKIRENISHARTGRKHSAESRKKMSENMKGRIPWNKDKKGLQVYPETAKEKLKFTYKNKTFVERFGKEKAEEIKKQISETKKGKSSGMLGKSHSEQTKLLMSQNMRKPKGPQKRISNCPICNKELVTSRHIKFCKINR